ncbi:MAG: potassium channel protein [bacterium]
MELRQRLIAGLIVLVTVMSGGVLGYMLIEGGNVSFLDALYMVVITLSTVGYGETWDMSGKPELRIFTIFLILFGMGVLIFFVSTATAFIVEGELKDVIWRRRLQKMLQKLDRHFIICGAGLTGIHIVNELHRTLRPMVVIETNEEVVNTLRTYENLPVIRGDATDDDVLREAGIEQAVGLIAGLPTDKDNLYLTITAKQINPKLRVVAKGVDTKVNSKLIKAGADSVVTPNFIGGLRMASELIRPSVVSFLDLMLRDKKKTLRIEEVTVPPGSPAAGKTLRDLNIPAKTDMIVVAVGAPHDGSFQYAPKAETTVEEGSALIVLGDVANLSRLERLVGY